MGVASDAAGAGTSSFTGRVLSGAFTSDVDDGGVVVVVVVVVVVDVVGSDFCTGCDDARTLRFSFAGEA